jgi:formate dehydrogenase accessory protein FdhE
VIAARSVERMMRAKQLASMHPAAAEMLRFYAGVAATQRAIVELHEDAVRRAGSFSESLDCAAAARAMPRLLSALADTAPAPLASAARAMHADETAHRRFVEECWAGGASHLESLDGIAAFIAEALLQPFAEMIAMGSDPITKSKWGLTPSRCGVCGGKPTVAVLREQGHGARRSAVCGFCLTEIPATRLECLACGETTFGKLPVFRDDTIPAGRIDACETCHTYIKTIDMTRDGLAEPIVDDLATLPLDLWAREQGYGRLRPNLLRV